jgi:hypothetical protein
LKDEELAQIKPDKTTIQNDNVTDAMPNIDDTNVVNKLDSPTTSKTPATTVTGDVIRCDARRGKFKVCG